MKLVRQFLPPRQSVIYGYTRRMLDETATNANSFAMAVAELYLARVAPDQRQVKFRLGDGDDLLAAMRNNGQILRRYMDGTLKVLPADLEEAWIIALPDAYRSECERELGRRRSFYPVRVLEPTAGAEAAGMAQLATEVGQLFEALSHALADGRVDEQDLPHVGRILDETDDVIAAVLAIRRRFQSLLPKAPGGCCA
jgi:hypothetical protein